jgi:glucan phosphorylase
LFYDQGYFKQQLDIDGYQHEEYLQSRTEALPIEPALGADGKPITVQIDTRSGPIFAKVWKMAVGRVNLILLDSDVEVNNPEDRELTSRLYGGDSRLRIRQELVLGVGGVRAIRAASTISTRGTRSSPRWKRSAGGWNATATRSMTRSAVWPARRCSPRTRRCPPATTGSTAD